MEWVGHNHNACYATLHGVGYSGGNGFGNHGSKKVNNIRIINMRLNRTLTVSNGLLMTNYILPQVLMNYILRRKPPLDF